MPANALNARAMNVRGRVSPHKLKVCKSVLHDFFWEMVVSSQRCALAGTGEGVLIHTAHGLPGLTFKLNPEQKLITAIFMIMWTCHLGW